MIPSTAMSSQGSRNLLHKKPRPARPAPQTYSLPSTHEQNTAKRMSTSPPPSPQPPSLVTPCQDSSLSMQQQQQQYETTRKRRRTESYTKPKETRTVETSFTSFRHIGEGTYGSIFVTTDKRTSRQVALKRIKTNSHDTITAIAGFPLPTIREIKLLQTMNHQNILKLNEIVTSKGKNQMRQDFDMIFMVFDYIEYDLAGMLGLPQIASRLTKQHCKSWAKQLLDACLYMHTNRILHRDIKPANIFICKDGTLKIGDFGLARTNFSPGQRLTGLVVTLWYRAPELLLGCATYDSKIDLWSVGCVLAELFYYTDPLFSAVDENQQRQLVFGTCGLPRTSSWPQVEQEWPLYRTFRLANRNFASMANALPRRLEQLKAEQEVFRGDTKNASNSDIELIVNLLQLNPHKRWSAKDALLSNYILEEPKIVPKRLNMKFDLNHAHDLDVRKLGNKKKQQERTEAKKAQHEMQSISSKWLSANN